ncbi:MAG: antibiotic biosynthesis monooxygenase [Cellvibrionales bacterium]|nr:antibiotic biosynthesis monooxygenase [Cellvibrionales bacterium]
MFVVSNRLYLNEAYGDELSRRFQARVPKLKEQTGFVKMQVLKSQGKETPWIIQTTWATQQDFKNWVQSPDFKDAHANPMPEEAFERSGNMEQHTIAVDSDA